MRQAKAAIEQDERADKEEEDEEGGGVSRLSSILDRPPISPGRKKARALDPSLSL